MSAKVNITELDHWDEAHHPHQTDTWARSYTAAKKAQLRCLQATNGNARVIVPLACDERGWHRTPDYGGPMWWGEHDAVREALAAVRAWVLSEGAGGELRAAPTQRPPPLGAFGTVRSLGPTVLVPVGPEPRMRQAMSRGLRRDLGRAERAGYQARIETTAVLPGCVAIAAAAEKSWPRTEIVTSLHAAGMDVRIYLARTSDGEPVACQIALAGAGVVEVWAAACLPEHRPGSPIKLLDWLTLQHAAFKGDRIVHVGGAANLEGCADGLLLYKRRLGGVEVPDLVGRATPRG